MNLLELKKIRAAYGRIEVLNQLDMHVQEGEIVALIGANGAGKTTLLRTLSGVHPLAGGTIEFGGVDISHATPRKRVQQGIAQVPEGRQVFGPLSVLDNLVIGAYVRPQDTLQEDIERMFNLFPVLRDKQHLAAGTLSGGQQQMLAFARAMMAKPKLLLLDEPSMGLAPVIVEDVFRTIERVRKEGTTVLLVEQNAHLALRVADRAYVIESGHMVLSGDSQEIRRNPQVQQAYLGV
jgi:branched-chain amino acid transport system ATP-binding protein